jgi:glutaminyl-peptide cyclotransferase
MRSLGIGTFGVALLGLGCGLNLSTQEEPKPPPKVGFAEDRVPKPGDPKPGACDGDRAMKYLKQLCDLGPRLSGSDGMKKQQELLDKHFADLGGKVTRQEFTAKQSSQRAEVALVNMIVSWYPERKERIILCAHYDTRPLADQEANPKNWTKPFVSANDGTSGVALMMELAHQMKDLTTGVGVDFVIFDGEEYVFTGPERQGDKFFLGSEHFAEDYAKQLKAKKIAYKYTAAILFDLFAHPNAKLNIEGHSWDNAKELLTEIWRTAEAQKAKSFKFARGFERATHVLDDHVALQNVGIPAINIVDFDYDDWHKLSDTPAKCSGAQMAEVGGVMLAWLKGK